MVTIVYIAGFISGVAVTALVWEVSRRCSRCRKPSVFDRGDGYNEVVF